MASNDSKDGCAGVAGGALIFVIVVIAAIPKEIWIVLGIVVAVVLLMWLAAKAVDAITKSRDEADKRERAAQAAKTAAEKQQREEAIRKAKQQLIEKIGEKNALLVHSARTSVKKVTASESARAGWLGDVDFTADIKGIIENFAKAQELRKVADKLAALDNLSADDTRIFTEAKATAEKMEHAGIQQVRLIAKCAAEAKLIDESLQTERKDARTAEKRAELHGQLNAMLYGIEAAPAATPADSTADAVMARVQAYREIKHQIYQARRSDG